MKRNTLLFMLVLLGWSSFNVWAATAITTQVDVSSQIQVTRSGLVLNRSTRTYDTTVTLTNFSTSVMPGPFLVSVNGLTPTNVSLANATGASTSGVTVNAVSAQQSLNPGQSISGIVLKFNNPGNVTFKFNTQVLGVIPSQQGVNNLTTLLPASGYSSTTVTVTGTNFTPYSIISFGNIAIQNFDFISPQQIQFPVPLSVNSNGHLVSLDPGSYTVSVDGGNSSNFTVNQLPANPNPAGQKINTLISNLSLFISQNHSNYQSAIVSLQSGTNDANLKFLLANIANFDVGLLNLLNTDLPNAIASLDAESLDTIERLLLLNQTSSIKLANNNINGKLFAGIKNNDKAVLAFLNIIGISDAMAGSSAAPFPGNTWLDSRQTITNYAKISADIDKIVSLISYGITGATAVASGPASVVSVPASVLMAGATMAALNVANGIIGNVLSAVAGKIDTFNIDVNSADGKPVGQLITISNADMDLGTTKTFINPTITSKHQLDTIGLILSLAEFNALNKAFNASPSLFSTMRPTWFDNLLPQIRSMLSLLEKQLPSMVNVVLNPQITPTEICDQGPCAISIDRVEWDDSSPSLASESPLCKSIFPGYVDITQGVVSVNDNTPIPNAYNTIAKCRAEVARAYRTSSEGSVNKETDFLIYKYSRVDASIASGLGSVVSTQPSVTNNPGLDCIKGYFGPGICSGYFDEKYSLKLTATPDSGYSFSGWSGALCAEGNLSPVCTISLSAQSINITATFNKDTSGYHYAPLMYAAFPTRGSTGTITYDQFGVVTNFNRTAGTLGGGFDLSENMSIGTSYDNNNRLSSLTLSDKLTEHYYGITNTANATDSYTFSYPSLTQYSYTHTYQETHCQSDATPACWDINSTESYTQDLPGNALPNPNGDYNAGSYPFDCIAQAC